MSIDDEELLQAMTQLLGRHQLDPSHYRRVCLCGWDVVFGKTHARHQAEELAVGLAAYYDSLRISNGG